jgi:hypothetical protein
LAPSAARTAISVARVSTCPSINAATFVQAIRSSSAIAASVAIRLGRTSPTRNSRAGVTDGDFVLSHRDGYLKRAPRADVSAASGPSMCSSDMPSAARPTSEYLPDRFCGFSCAAVQILVAGLGNQKPRGITPTTVRGTPPN